MRQQSSLYSSSEAHLQISPFIPGRCSVSMTPMPSPCWRQQALEECHAKPLLCDLNLTTGGNCKWSPAKTARHAGSATRQERLQRLRRLVDHNHIEREVVRKARERAIGRTVFVQVRLACFNRNRRLTSSAAA